MIKASKARQVKKVREQNRANYETRRGALLADERRANAGVGEDSARAVRTAESDERRRGLRQRTRTGRERQLDGPEKPERCKHTRFHSQDSATSFDEDLGTLVSTTCQAQCNPNQNFVAHFLCQPNNSSGDDDL